MTSIAAISVMRAALAPLRHESESVGTAPATMVQDAALASVLRVQGLGPLWSDLAESRQVFVSESLRLELIATRRLATARYLLQRRTAARVSECLGSAGIQHAVFKGAAVRERLYAAPALRPASDIDVLVKPESRDLAVRALVREHYRLLGARATISHEANLSDRYSTIDLHWALFRPGRGRFELTPVLLETTHPLGPFCVLSEDANLLVMLVHPAFAKHVNGRCGRLIRAVDLDRMLRIVQPDWGWILSLIEAAGLSTAAWAVLYWQRLLMDTPVDPAVLRHLEPGRLKRRYLAYWIEHQLPARLAAIPGLVQGAFTLALHERPRDALSASVQLLKARLESGRTLRHLQRLSQTLE